MKNISLKSLQGLYTFFSIAVSIFLARYKSIQKLQTLHAVVFFILQHFGTELCNFINFRTLFNAVVMIVLFQYFYKNFVYYATGLLRM